MAAQLKIDYLTGYPGIPASDPTVTPNPPSDPFVKLPVLLRPQGHLSGTVEVRPPLKGTRAKWLRVELEKVEIVPAPAIQRAKGEDSKRDKAALAEAKKEVRFVELIGNGPGTLWAAKEPSGDTDTLHGKKMKKNDDEEGWDFIPENNYPFRIPLPEGLPPTTTVDSKGSGIEYQLVATLCGRGKKSLLKSNAKPILTSATAPVLLLKADILPSWPAYAPLLPHPIPDGLPWARASDSEVPGETREAKMQMRVVGGGEIFIRVTREKGAYGPGDKVDLQVTLWSASSKPVKVLRLDSVLRESLTFRYPPPVNNAQPLRSPPRVTSIFTSNATISASPDDNPEGFAVLYQNRPLTFALSGVIPSGHTRVTVRTAKHIDVVYHMKIRAMLDGGEEVAIDNWATLMGAVGSREAKGLMEEIGWVEGLCDRPRPPAPGDVDEPEIRAKSISPHRPTPVPIPTTSESVRARTSSLPLADSGPSTSSKLKSAFRNSAYGDFPPPTPPDEETQANTLANTTPGRSANGHTNGSVNSSRRSAQGGRYASPAPPQPSLSPVPPPKNVATMDGSQRDDGPPPPMPNGSTKTYMSAEDEKLRLFQSARQTAAQQQLRIQNQSTESTSARMTTSHSNSPSAEEEKERLYRQAQERRDILQASVSGSMPSPESEKMRLYREALDRRDYLQAAARSSLDTQTDRSFEDEKARLHQANVLSNEQAQASLVRRSRLQAAMETDRNGKNVNSGTDRGDYFSLTPSKSNPSTTPYSSPSTTATSTRANPSTAAFSPENEKRRLFEEAKALAQQRQEQARAELDRQNALLAEMEREEIHRLEQELEEERLRNEAVVQARRVREEFEREQAERARVAEEKVQQRRMQEALEIERRETEAREQARREAEAREDSRRREAEARRVAEQDRQAEAYRQSQLLKERMQREKDQAEVVAELQRAASAQAREAQVPQRVATVNQEEVASSANAAPLQSSLALSQSRGELAAPQPVFAKHGASLERASSSASFAPGTNLSQATSAFYANAIANNSSTSQSPTTSEEKTAYLRTLRAREEARRKESIRLSHSPTQKTPERRSAGQASETSGYEQQMDRGPTSPPATNQSAPHTRHAQYASGEGSNAAPNQSYSHSANISQHSRQPLPVPSSTSLPANYRLGEPLYEQVPQPAQPAQSPPVHHSGHSPSSSSAQTANQPLHQQTYDVVPPTPQHLRHSSAHADPYAQRPTPSFAPVQPLFFQSRTAGRSSRSPPAVLASSNGYTGSSETNAGPGTTTAGGSSQSPPQQYKTAREEKEEEESRRKVAAMKGSSEEDGLPNYISETGNSSQPAPSAAEEKQQLNAYYAAKAAVDAFSQSRGPPPPLPPMRQSTSASISSMPIQHGGYSQPQRAYSSPLGAIQEASSNGRRENGVDTSPPQAVRSRHRPDSSSEGSFENHRDPAVSAGKKKVNTSSTPPLSQQHHREGSGYQLTDVDFGTFSIGHDFNAAQEYLQGGSGGVGGSQYHS